MEIVLVAVAATVVKLSAIVNASVVIEPRPIAFAGSDFRHEITKFWFGRQNGLFLEILFLFRARFNAVPSTGLTKTKEIIVGTYMVCLIRTFSTMKCVI